MENFISVLFIVGIPLGLVISLVALYYAHKKLKETQNELQRMSEIAGNVQDGDGYLKERQEEANELIEKARATAERIKVRAQNKADKIEAEVSALTSERDNLQSEIATLELDNLTGMVKIDAYEELRSDEIKNELSLLSGRQDDLLKNGEAIIVTSSGLQKKILNNQIKQLLRCFNAECSNILSSVTVKNVDTSRSKIQRSFDALNKIFAADGVQITPAYLSSKFEELSLIYAYMVKEEEEKEQRKAIREQMVEEEKVRKEIEREKLKIEKEQTQFTNEVNKLIAYMQKAKDDVERTLYLDKIKELEDKLKALEADKENVLQREQNTRAGFVYIISNIGSFGEQVFKIGMTRRLEPMDRISELSSASVPFPFDVHALIFSDDAPGLENILHQHFDKNRVNKVNPRKEFFRINLDEIKQVVLENHNATVQFIDVPDALEYRETLKLAE